MKKESKKPTLNSQTITVKTNQENPEPLELIAESIIKLADSFTSINNSRLSQRAILLLLHDMSGVPMGQIKEILTAGENLRKFIKK